MRIGIVGLGIMGSAIARNLIKAGEAVADLMVEADLRGSDTHGVIRLPLYLRRLRAGGIKARPDIRAVEAALNLYRLDNFVYPTTDQGLEALVEQPSSPEPPNWKAGGYLDRLPQDPWKQPYQFLSPGSHGTIDIYSLGPDQQPSDDDIGNWNLQ